MKLAILIAAVLLSGCATMDPHQADAFRQNFMGALAVGAAHEQQRNYQMMQRRPIMTTCSQQGRFINCDSY